MPFLAPLIPALVSAAPAIGAATAVAGAVQSRNAQRSAGRQATRAAEQAVVDPQEIARVAREQAATNIQNSLALEQQYTPENAALRQGSIRALLERANNDPTGDAAIQAVLTQLASQPTTPNFGEQPDFGAQPTFTQANFGALPEFGTTNVRSRLLDNAIQMANADLAQGGALPQDVRNEVARNSIANAGRVGGGSLGLSRFLTPRDLGISSLDLRNQRLDRASQLGAQDVASNQQNFANRLTAGQTNFQNRFNTEQQGYANRTNAAQQEFQNRTNTAQQQFQNRFNTAQQGFQNEQSAQQLRSQLATLLSNLGTNQTNRYLSMANFGQSLQPPESGLSPGDVASLYTQNATNRAQAGINAANVTAQTGRNTGQLLGGLGGMIQGVDWNSIFNRGGATPPYVYGSTTPVTFGGGSIPGVNVPP